MLLLKLWGPKEISYLFLLVCKGERMGQGHTDRGQTITSRGQSLFHRMGIRNRTRVIRLGDKHFPTEPLAGLIGHRSASLTVNMIGSGGGTRKGMLSTVLLGASS